MYFLFIVEELDGKYILNKTTESLRNVFLRDMQNQVKSRKSCMFCKQPMDRIQTLKNRIIQVTNKLNLEYVI